ncbi:Rib/alpha-like domain-containing protein, partial [Streptococcus suis]
MKYKYRGKKNKLLKEEKRQINYGIRKLSVGVVTCIIGCSIFFGHSISVLAESKVQAGTSETTENSELSSSFSELKQLSEEKRADDIANFKDSVNALEATETPTELVSEILLKDTYQPQLIKREIAEGDTLLAESFISNLGELPEGTIVSYKQEVDFSVVGEQEVSLSIIYPDNTIDEGVSTLVIEGSTPVINNEKSSDPSASLSDSEIKPKRAKRELREDISNEGERTSEWKSDTIEDGSDAVTISESGTSGWSSIGWRRGTREVFYQDSKGNGLGDNFGWSSKPGGNSNYADELIRIHAKQDGDVIHWRVVMKAENSGEYKGVARDFQRPYFLFTVSRGLGKPENIIVTDHEEHPKNYSSNWDELNSYTRKIYNPRQVNVNGKNYSLLGSTSYPMTEWTGGYRLGNTGDSEDGKNYNIEKYTYYSKYTLEDWQNGHAGSGSTRQYYFDTKILWDEIAELGNVPNVDSQFSKWMNWGNQRADVDLSNKVWVIGGITSREGTNNAQTPNGAGIYNFSKIAIVTPTPVDTTGPSAPQVVAEEDGSVTVTPPTEPDTKKVEISYTPEGGDKETTVTVEKGEDGKWKPTTPNTEVTVDPNSGIVTIPEDKVKDNTPVKATAKDNSDNPSEEGKDTAKPKPTPVDTTGPSAPQVVAEEDGSVTVTPPTEPDTKKVEISYTPEG